MKKGIKISIIVIAVLVMFIISVFIVKDNIKLGKEMDYYLGGNETESTSTKKESSSKKDTNKDKEEDITTAERFQKEYTFEEYSELCEEIDYKDLARSPETNKYKNIKFTGKIIQVMEEDGMALLRVNTKKYKYYSGEIDYTDDTIAVLVEKNDKNNRFLEDDIVEFYGVTGGLYTYETVVGSELSIPVIVDVYHKLIK